MSDEKIIDTILEFDPIETRPETDVRAMIKAMTQVIPEELIATLENLSDVGETLQWGRGDCANAVWDLVRDKRLKNKRKEVYTFIDVCYFVAVKYTKGQRSFSTIKGNALVARRFPQTVREKYHYKDLPFAHFAYASKKKFEQVQAKGKYKGLKTYRAILEYSWELSQKQLHPPSLALLKEKFEGIVAKPNPVAYATGSPLTGLDFQPIQIPQGGNGKDAGVADFAYSVEEEFIALVEQIDVMIPTIANGLENARLAVRLPDAVATLKEAAAKVRKPDLSHLAL